MSLAHYAGFQVEQGLLFIKSTPVANQLSVSSDDPMAGHNDGNGIGSSGTAYCPTGGWATESASYLPV